MAAFTLENYRPYRFLFTEDGPHVFGGPPRHDGVVPDNTDTPLHLCLNLDISDPDCPLTTETNIRFLPLYYPLKYGGGGPETQYSVESDTEIRLLYMSDESPDDVDEQYVQVDELPSCNGRLVPLEYEEARVLEFLSVDAYFGLCYYCGTVITFNWAS